MQRVRAGMQTLDLSMRRRSMHGPAIRSTRAWGGGVVVVLVP